jgi:hypothetical protein
VLIIWESSLGAILLSALLQFYFVIIPCISTYSYTCWVPTTSVLNLAIFLCYSIHAAEKMKMDWNSSMRSSRLALPRLISCGLWSLPLFCFCESHHSLWRHYLCNNYTLFVTFDYSVNTFCPCVWNKWSWEHMRWVFNFGHKTGYDNAIINGSSRLLLHMGQARLGHLDIGCFCHVPAAGYTCYFTMHGPGRCLGLQPTWIGLNKLG